VGDVAPRLDALLRQLHAQAKGKESISLEDPYPSPLPKVAALLVSGGVTRNPSFRAALAAAAARHFGAVEEGRAAAGLASHAEARAAEQAAAQQTADGAALLAAHAVQPAAVLATLDEGGGWVPPLDSLPCGVGVEVSGLEAPEAARPLLFTPLASYPLEVQLWLETSTTPQTVVIYEERPAPPGPPAPPGAKGEGKGEGEGEGEGKGKPSRTPLLRLTLEAVPRGVLDVLRREGKPTQRLLHVGVDASGLLDVDLDDLDEPEARWGGWGQMLLLLMLLSGLVGFAGSVLGMRT